MNAIQKTAIKETAKTVGAITIGVLVVGTIIEILSLQAIATMALLYCLVMCIKMIYDDQVIKAREKQAEIDAEIDRLHK